MGRIDRQNSRFRTAKTIIIKFGLHTSFIELESAKSALNESFREVGGRERKVGGPCPPHDVLPKNWGDIKPNRTVACMMLKVKAKDKRKSSLLQRKNSSATAGSDVVQSGRPIFDDFFQHLWPYISNNTANVVFQMAKRLWLIRIDQ
ncbi:hypothetical protein TNCV_3129591 [Trichonephila clavipes]|nr:hypothetical protein TNCV_3129591 [Trichonephila clavipes]